MAQAQTPTVFRPVRATWRPTVVLAAVSLLLIVAIGLAIAASGVFTRAPSVNAGDVGTREWITFRAGERGPLTAPPGNAVIDMGPRARAAGEMSEAGISGSLAGAGGGISTSATSVSDPLTSSSAIDLRRCERDGC